MNLFEAFILGIVQGLTEFLPVSSSGHLVIFQRLLGLGVHDINFDILLHLATLIAVCLYFYKRFLQINKKIFLLLIIATIPAALAGFFLESLIEETFSSLIYTGIGLIWTGMILLFSQKFKEGSVNLKDLPIPQSLLIGIMQALAIIPGISRSGSTVTAALFVGLNKKDAFYFSFLMSVPVILGASVLQFSELESLNSLVSITNVIGFLTAMIMGLIALKVLDKLIVSDKFHYFGYYCLTLGLIILSYNFLI